VIIAAMFLIVTASLISLSVVPQQEMVLVGFLAILIIIMTIKHILPSLGFIVLAL